MRGLVNAVLAYLIWGCFPLFFSLLAHVPAMTVLSYRIVFACVFAVFLLSIRREFVRFSKELVQKKTLLWSLVSSLLISINWFVFIWAVSQGRVVESSLGYFITPLVSLVLGRIFLKEAINRYQFSAGVVAACAILFELVALGGVPWVSLVLALSFGLYGLVRKLQPMESLSGLTLETLWVLPLAVLFIGYQEWGDFLKYSVNDYLLLILSGVVTAIPLLLFASSVRSLNLVVAGFIMYLNPIMQFVSAVWILDEVVPMQRYVTVLLVWIAMGLFIKGLVDKSRAIPKPV